MAAKKKRAKRPAPKSEDAELTIQQVKFCKAYADDGNAVQAYFKANIAPKAEVGTSAYHDAATLATRLLNKSKIRTLLARMIREAVDAEQISVNKLAQNFARIAFTNRLQIFHADGTMRNPATWPEDLQCCIAGVEPVVNRQRRLSDAGELEDAPPTAWKVKFLTGTEERKMLATWQKMIGQKEEPAPEDTESDAKRSHLDTVVEQILESLPAIGSAAPDDGGQTAGSDEGGVPVRAESGAADESDAQPGG